MLHRPFRNQPGKASARKKREHPARNRAAVCSVSLAVALLTAALIPFPAHSQVNNDKYRDYFLVGEFGEICTMCEIIVLCENTAVAPAYEAIPANGEFTVYHLQTRTFWSQIGTIWDWFIANFSSAALAQGHARPVWIYTSTNGGWSGPVIADAWVALEPPLLSFGDRHIDRTNQAWLKAEDMTTTGYCQRLPLWASLDILEHKSDEGGQP